MNKHIAIHIGLLIVIGVLLTITFYLADELHDIKHHYDVLERHYEYIVYLIKEGYLGQVPLEPAPESSPLMWNY